MTTFIVHWWSFTGDRRDNEKGDGTRWRGSAFRYCGPRDAGSGTQNMGHGTWDVGCRRGDQPYIGERELCTGVQTLLTPYVLNSKQSETPTCRDTSASQPHATRKNWQIIWLQNINIERKRNGNEAAIRKNSRNRKIQRWGRRSIQQATPRASSKQIEAGGESNPAKCSDSCA